MAFNKCGGCIKNCGKPFGGNCVASDIILNKGFSEFIKYKDKLIGIINDLGIEDLKINDLNLLSGSYVNLEYELENAIKVKFLNDNDIYLGQQIERKNNDRCYGVVANLSHLLVCEYGCNVIEPELLIYKKLNI